MSSPRNDWGKILAYAWSQPSQGVQPPQVLDDLRKDPKATVQEIAKGANSRYQTVVQDAQEAAQHIIDQVADFPGESYIGYVPVPEPTGGLETLTEEQLEELISNGLTGLLQFDAQPKEWAKILGALWKDGSLASLKNFQQNPLEFLRASFPAELETLLQSEYGIFPLPNRPRGLEAMEIENLDRFLTDEDNAKHLSGIFLIGT
jgi:hypothetical protein